MATRTTTDRDREERFGEIVFGYLQAAERGEPTDRRQWLAQHPEFAAELEQFLGDIDGVGRLATPIRALVHPTHATTSALSDGGTLGDYRLIREVGRGGMGIVYEAEQISLSRRVALKVLPFAATMDPRQLQRFRNEAQAAACLHHANIVPVYGVGVERGVHYYAMQLIEGQTLAEIIASSRERERPESGRASQRERDVEDVEDSQLTLTPRRDVEDSHVALTPRRSPSTAPIAALSTKRDRTHFRSIAELIATAADALEYAHSIGVLHRDIKPGNLMLDNGGGLWITDFGLAKLANPAREGVGEITMSGDMIGTLRYMSPETALAKHGLVDYRTDIYSLGATLYELLTLQPAIAGADKAEILKAIAWDDPTPLRKHDKSIPDELETITLKCLAKEPGERYATAGEVAEDLRRWAENKPIRARRPTLKNRVVKWTRRHPGVGAVIALAVLLGGGMWIWLTLKESARMAATSELLNEALGQAADRVSKGKWPEAVAPAQRARGLMAGGVSADHHQRTVELLADLRMVAELEEIRLRQAGVKDEHFDISVADRDYAQAFRDFGVDIQALDAETAAARIRTRGIRVELAASLNNWALVRKVMEKSEKQSWKHLLAIARIADPDTWRDGLRDALEHQDREALKRLAVSDQVLTQSAPSLVLLGDSLRSFGAFDEAATLLRKAQQQFPADFWINHDLGLSETEQSHWREAIPFFTAALAIRPESPGVRVNLSHVLLQMGDFEWSIALCTEAIRLKPDYADAHINLGFALEQKGDLTGAIAEYQMALAIRPNHAGTHVNLGIALKRKGEPAAAIAEYQKAIALDPDDAKAHNNLGNSLKSEGNLPGAIAEYQKAITINPKYSNAHHNLGRALKDMENRAGAIAEYQKAIALDPSNAEVHHNLGNAYSDNGEVPEAIAEFEKAIALNPQLPETHYCLGNVLKLKGDLPGAIAAYQQAINLGERKVGDSPLASGESILGAASNNLAIILRDRGQLAELRQLLERAVSHQQAALRINPKNTRYRRFLRNHFGNLAETLVLLESHAEAAEAAAELSRVFPDTWQGYYSAAGFLSRCVPLSEKDPKLSETMRKELVQKYSARAVDFLRQAVQAGFKDVAQLQKDADLDRLRSRDDFKTVLAELEAKIKK